MERVYRTGIDIDVALATSARRLLAPAAAAVQPTASPVAESVTSPVTPESHNVTRQDIRGRIKRGLRRPVAIIYRLVKPFLRPIAFRTRRYLTETMHHSTLHALSDTQREIQRASAEMLREVQSAREVLRQEILTMNVQPMQEQSRLLTGLLQEQQATRDMIRRLIADSVQRNTHETARLAEAQQHQVIEATRLAEAQQHQVTETARLAEAQQHQVTEAARLAEVQQRQVTETARLAEAQLRQVTETARLVEEITQSITTSHLQRAEAAKISAADSTNALLSTLTPRLDRLEQYGYANARRTIVHCAQGELMVKTEAGFVVCSDSDLALLACLIDTGDLERGTRLLIERLLKPGDVFVDVGANVGMHTLAAARALRGQGKIIAFEPFEATRHLLEKTIWINGFDALTEIHGSALSDREGVQTLFLGASSGHHSLFELDSKAPASARVAVSTVRLDSVIDAGTRVNLMKIDAEGAELDVLRGALDVVRANQDIALIVEFGPAHLRRIGQTSAVWLRAFTDLGFSYRAIDAVQGTLDHVTLEQLEAAESTNLLFARPQAAPWARLGESE